MKVILSGMNVDRERLDEYRNRASTLADDADVDETKAFLREFSGAEDLTPETFSAAYARISRDPRSVNELRQDAVQQVDRARRSNESIIFGLGHSSVAEHAVFNLDIIDVTRRAVEELERSRLASYTEKSQRYITLTDDYLVPQEIVEIGSADEFHSVVGRLNAAYHRLKDGLSDYLEEKYPDMARDKKGKVVLSGWAKEDARYVVPLSTLTQLGMTANARVLEMTIRRLAAHPLIEVRELSRAIFDAVSPHAPSVIKYTTPTPYDIETDGIVTGVASRMVPNTKSTRSAAPADRQVTLVDYPEDADTRLAAFFLSSHGDMEYRTALEHIRIKGADAVRELILSAFSRMESYDRAPRELELIPLTFEAVVSSSCFGQLKRHRMATILSGPYDSTLGVTIPPSITEAGLEKPMMEAVDASESFYHTIVKRLPGCAEYILTNAHRRRVLVSMNLRELYHVARLRMDETAQWDIRYLAADMVAAAADKMPTAAALAVGKDAFETTKRDLYS
ncbi:MAG: FAD-dependent thymidylate synthase [Deltaproteobacteria bacterium]|nr:FAD-dependent thymidylate synthase [Candidatus Zymogenaceae bacterium]